MLVSRRKTRTEGVKRNSCATDNFAAAISRSHSAREWKWRFMFERINSGQSKWTAFLVFLFYSANFGNVLAISVVHSMEVTRYSTVLFITALFAELWALRWLMKIALLEFGERKSRTRRAFC